MNVSQRNCRLALRSSLLLLIVSANQASDRIAWQQPSGERVDGLDEQLAAGLGPAEAAMSPTSLNCERQFDLLGLEAEEQQKSCLATLMEQKRQITKDAKEIALLRELLDGKQTQLTTAVTEVVQLRHYLQPTSLVRPTPPIPSMRRRPHMKAMPVPRSSTSTNDSYPSALPLLPAQLSPASPLPSLVD